MSGLILGDGATPDAAELKTRAVLLDAWTAYSIAIEDEVTAPAAYGVAASIVAHGLDLSLRAACLIFDGVKSVR